MPMLKANSRIQELMPVVDALGSVLFLPNLLRPFHFGKLWFAVKLAVWRRKSRPNIRQSVVRLRYPERPLSGPSFGII